MNKSRRITRAGHGRKPRHWSDSKVIAVQTALGDRDPFCTGLCAIPDYQRLLYYSHNDLLRRVDFPNPGADDLEALYRACRPAEFGRNGENILDESYRKAGKMDLISFSTLLDPRRLGIQEQVSKALLTKSHAAVDAELYKLNVYGQGDFFKAHKDTPRGQDMFGSLVIVLPTPHEGGQFVLRQDETEWTIDFADKFATATEPFVCFVAFFGDIEHEVLPVTFGYRVTLTYNLYHKTTHPNALSIPTPCHLKLKHALVDLVNDASVLPDGGYLGFGLVHEYVHTGRNLLGLLSARLEGSDRALADVCDELGLGYAIRLFYPSIINRHLHLVTTKELNLEGSEPVAAHYLRAALRRLSSEQVEGVTLVGGPKFAAEPLEESDHHWYGDWLEPYYQNPVKEVLEITGMKSPVNIKTSFMAYGNQAELEFFYGTACMLIALEPAESRNLWNVREALWFF